MRQLKHSKLRVIWILLLVLNITDLLGTYYVLQSPGGELNVVAKYLWETFGFRGVVILKLSIWTGVFFMTEFIYRRSPPHTFFTVTLALIIMLFTNIMFLVFYLEGGYVYFQSH